MERKANGILDTLTRLALAKALSAYLIASLNCFLFVSSSALYANVIGVVVFSLILIARALSIHSSADLYSFGKIRLQLYE